MCPSQATLRLGRTAPLALQSEVATIGYATGGIPLGVRQWGYATGVRQRGYATGVCQWGYPTGLVPTTESTVSVGHLRTEETAMESDGSAGLMGPY